MKKNKLNFILLIFLLVFLVWSGINPPIGYSDWLLENSPIFVAIILFVILVRYLKLSTFSYVLITIYLIFPIIASHFGVTGVPFGETIGDWLGTTRNMYDRLTHFLFGFLIFYPIFEFVVSFTKREIFINYYIALETVLAFSAIYEIFEWLAAVTVNPILAASFYGSQGDIFDTPKDMAMAAVGALTAMFLVFLFRRYGKRFFLNK